MHIAAAFEVPQIALFGPTHPKLGFAPLNPNAEVLTLDLDCSPCTLHGNSRCPKDHFKCMKDLSPGIVLAQVDKVSLKVLKETNENGTSLLE